MDKSQGQQLKRIVLATALVTGSLNRVENDLRSLNIGFLSVRAAQESGVLGVPRDETHDQ